MDLDLAIKQQAADVSSTEANAVYLQSKAAREKAVAEFFAACAWLVRAVTPEIVKSIQRG